MMNQAKTLLSSSIGKVKNNRVRCCRSTYRSIIVFGMVTLFLFYGALQRETQNNHLLFSNTILINNNKTKSSLDNQLKRFEMSDYYFDRYQNDKSLPSSFTVSNEFKYSENIFRSSSFPILWLDSYGDVHWNEVAEREMYFYLLNKQTIDGDMTKDEIINECLHRQLFILRQHHAGFFSRVHCFIEQFGQSLYSPWMTIMSISRIQGFGTNSEDFLSEGILRYIEPISTCNKYVNDPRIKSIHQQFYNDKNNTSQKITDVHQLLYENQLKENKKYFLLEDDHVWSFGYEHVPLRRWMFGYNRFTPTYNLSIQFLTNHTAEHIYKDPSLTDEFLEKWLPRNRPVTPSKQHLPGQQYNQTWQDNTFTGFLRYMFVLYFHRYAPRIHRLTHLLAEHWSSYLMDKNRQLLNDTAAMHIRRGDKWSEDMFWHKYRRWRNISFYVKTLVDEEQRLNRRFSSIFIMTDDVSVMKSMKNYADPFSKGKDEPYARKHLQGRQIMYNVFAPEACFVSGSRIGYDQFLVSLQFIVQYAQFTVAYRNSNVARYLDEITYSRQQLKSSVHSDSFVKNAADSL